MEGRISQRLVLATALAWICLLTTFSQADQIEDTTATQLFEDYFQWRQQDNPFFASGIGNRSYDAAMPSLSIASRGRRISRAKELLKRVEELLKSELDFSTTVSAKVLMFNLNSMIEGETYKGYMIPITYLENVSETIRLLLDYLRFSIEDDYRNLLKRYELFPLYVNEMISMMKIGIAQGMVLHKLSVETLPAQLAAVDVADVQQSIFYKPFLDLAEDVHEPIRSELQMKAREAVTLQIVPALHKLKDFIEVEYMNNTRSSIGASTLPDGTSYYEACLKYHTSSDMTPTEVHQLGIEEVERIEKQMLKIVRLQGSNSKTISEFSNAIRSNPSYFHGDASSLVEGYTDIIVNRIKPKLLDVVWNLPQDDVIVEKLPAYRKKAVSASYSLPSFDGSRPGKFMINANLFDKLPKYEMVALALHEANPGHHFYFSNIKNNKGLPSFRRASGDMGQLSMVPAGVPSHTAIMEGWALYAESLGEPMGLYTDTPLEQYGAYSKEIFRACRLVVDTGLHAFNWTQEKAVQYMLDHSAASRAQIENEVRRYITWPGQATAYKIGEIRLKKLRSDAVGKLQRDFDLRTFHQVILDCAGPLDVVDLCVQRYVQQQGHWTMSGSPAKERSLFVMLLAMIWSLHLVVIR